MTQELGHDFEKLGWFYLGRPVDPVTMKSGGEPLLYDSRDLVTHAAIVGMTGSGKTGLGIALLEEAAIDGVPALIIDPKGDLSNLLLTFPDLSPDDFLPYLRAEDAERKGVTREALAAFEAAKWRDGLAEWGEDGDRIRRLRGAAEVALYTPGSELGRPISILASFAAPPAALVDDTDLFRDRVETAATSLLALAGVDADPLRSREHILLSTLLSVAWRAGRSYDLPALIADLQKPPVARVGVMDLETFYPAGDRFALAMRINNLLAAPGFEVWLAGEPLALDSLLHTPAGKPRLAVVSIAHLSDAERMFFVSLLLNETVSWMRSKSGTSSLRALLYMDELFGFLPPVANPPSKKPLLTLLKQARAFGLGVVVATQNPVDLDYKALSNIGTWFLGRLQTERDKARVLDGLEGASTAAGESFDRADVDRLLSGLRARVFLMHNVHDEKPTLFETRWAMSYLAGPLDREAIRRLAGGTASKPHSNDGIAIVDGGSRSKLVPNLGAPSTDLRVETQLSPGGKSAVPGERPVLNPKIRETFVAPALVGNAVAYRPALLGKASVYFEDSGAEVEEETEVTLLAVFGVFEGDVWKQAKRAAIPEVALETGPRPGLRFWALPASASDARWYPRWEKSLQDFLYRNERLQLLESPELGETSRPNESEAAFRVRVSHGLREQRDVEKEKLRLKFAPQFQKLDLRIASAQARLEKENSDVSQRSLESVISVGSSVFGALFGRRRLSSATISRAGTAVRSVSRVSRERDDVARATESLSELQASRKALESDFDQALQSIVLPEDGQQLEVRKKELKPRRAGIQIKLVSLVWLPEDEASAPLWL